MSARCTKRGSAAASPTRDPADQALAEGELGVGVPVQRLAVAAGREQLGPRGIEQADVHPRGVDQAGGAVDHTLEHVLE
jgi:hypothetical protein